MASERWSDWVRRTPAVKAEEEDEERGGIKAATSLALFKPAVINDKTHTHTWSELTPARPLLKHRASAL